MKLSKIRLSLPVRLLIAALVALVTASGCGGGGGGGGGSVATGTNFGASVPVGNGTGRAYITVQNGVPISAGVELTAAAIQNLPQPPPGLLATEFIFPMPTGMNTTPFQQVSMFYSPGHPPAHQQDVPHLHPTWWTVSPAFRTQIQETTPPQYTIPIPPQYLPANHITLSAFQFIQNVGCLYIDPSVPGYREIPMVTTAYEYRFYNAQMTCIALDCATSYLPTHPDLFAKLEQPPQYQTHGYYPTAYHIRYDPARNVYDLSIDLFVPE